MRSAADASAHWWEAGMTQARQRRTLRAPSPVDAAIWLCPHCFWAVVLDQSVLLAGPKTVPVVVSWKRLAAFGAFGKYLLDA